MVAEKSMVWRWWEHIRIISFICSSKYSSSILEEEDRCAEEELSGRVVVTQASKPTTQEAQAGGLCDQLSPPRCYLRPSILQGTEIMTAYPPMSQHVRMDSKPQCQTSECSDETKPAPLLTHLPLHCSWHSHLLVAI